MPTVGPFFPAGRTGTRAAWLACLPPPVGGSAALRAGGTGYPDPPPNRPDDLSHDEQLAETAPLEVWLPKVFDAEV